MEELAPMPPRGLRRVLLLAVALHIAGMARSPLPAQDGLKFIRVAQSFQSQPWLDVIRSSDQHPLYPAAIAAFEPVVARFLGVGPDAWRIAAQGVSALATVLLLIPLFGLIRGLFDEQTAVLGCLLFAVLPLSGSVGHDTLSDPLALLMFTTALHLGLQAWRQRRRVPAVLAGLAAGLGYWTRPEVAVVAVVLLGMSSARFVAEAARSRRFSITLTSSPRPGPAPLLAVAFLASVGLYAAFKGEVSEKLALRRAAGVASRHDVARKSAHWLPPGLDDPRWDFSPKEESDHPGRLGILAASARTLLAWAEGLGWVLAPLAAWGAVRVRSNAGRAVAAAYGIAFGAVLVRHAMGLGYLSGRHALTLVVATIPWASAGAIDAARTLAVWLRLDPERAAIRRRAAVAAVVAIGALVQAKPAHASRWGHQAAGRWLAEHAAPGDAVLDTRGWAAFVSGCRSYGPWHLRQALTDSRLAFVVIGSDELTSRSRRAETWRAMLDYAADPVAAFPARRGGRGDDVRVYRFVRPATWEGIAP
jgi:hypothetical protein